MAVLKNRAKMSTSTTGTGTITLGSAESGYQTFGDAGVANADVVRYVIEDGAAWEIGTGTYTATSTTLTRTVSESSNADAAIVLTGSAVVFVGATAEDIYTDADVDTHLNKSTATTGEVLSWSGTDYDWIAAGGGSPDLYRDNAVTATTPTASGSNAVAIGTGATATQANSFSMGSSANATNSTSLALGTNSTASGFASTAISGATASSDRSTAIGYNSGGSPSQAVTGSGAMALGGSYASGTDSFAAAITNNTSTYGATGNNSISVGRLAKASNTGGNAIGWGALSTHEYSSAFGVNATTTTSHQVALGGSGYTVLVSGAYKFPTADGSANQVLQTNGSGVLSFATAGGGGGADLFAESYDGTSGLPVATGSTNAVAVGRSYASGTDSFAAAIANNTSSYGATGANSVAMGSLSKATNSYATVSGGTANVASGYHSTVVGGSNNLADNIGSTVLGGRYGTTRGIRGATVFAGFGNQITATQGTSQSGLYILAEQTTDATATALKTDNQSSVSTVNQVILPNNSAYAFHGTIVARQSAAQGTASAAWKVEGLIRREANAGTTVLVNSATTVLDNTPSWGMALTADTTNGGLAITVTGAAATNIRFVATINTSELIYA